MMKTDDTLDRFMMLTKEYKRFADYFSELENRVIEKSEEDVYISLYTRLMLLRKYGPNSGDLSFKKVLNRAGRLFPDNNEDFAKLKELYNSLYQSFEYILPDNTSRHIDEAIEDVIYGLFLHADSERIQRVIIADDSMRNAAVKEYVTTLERIILETYEILLPRNENWGFPMVEREKAHIIYLGSKDSVHDIKGSPYWSNAYGRDATAEDIKEIFKNNTDEDNHILMFCEAFVQKLYKEDYSASELQWYVFPPTKSDWGDFSVWHKAFIEIQDIGFGSKVRYNDRHDMAYVRLIRNVKDPFIVSQPHLSNDITTITLVKDNERYGWRIYSIGDPLEHYKDTLGLGESIRKVFKDSKGFIKRGIIKRLIEE